MGTIYFGGCRFRIHPQDHEPVHAHGRYAETIVVVELRPDGTVTLADRDDAIIPGDAKRSDVRKILSAAAQCFEEIAAEWERMQER